MEIFASEYFNETHHIWLIHCFLDLCMGVFSLYDCLSFRI